MSVAVYIGHAITAAVAILLTSGIWLAIYFAGIKPASKGGDTYNYYGNCSTDAKPTSGCVPPPAVTCEKTCEFVICESIPAGLQFDPSYPIFNNTTNCWMRLMIKFISIFFNNFFVINLCFPCFVGCSAEGYGALAGKNKLGELIYNTILKTAQSGVKVRIAQTYQDGGYPETADLAANSNGNLEVRSLDFTQWYRGGILHTKSWAVDGKHFYVGSANFDWRSLTQVKELGMAVFNCPCLAKDFRNLLEIYWDMGAPGAKIPQRWYGRLDDAIRRAAFDRQVKVRFLHSRWPHTASRAYSYLHSLQDISSQLQCKYEGGKCVRRGSIDIRFIQVPLMQYGSIPFARVYHNKYFVTEKAAYIGTSNWSADYWKYTAGIGMVVRSDDTSQQSFIVDQLAQVFERDWNSDYVIPLSYFDNDGNWTNTTRSTLN
ncbi:hypothetical protein GCK32_005909 [Trichostrongylus colubriformis]|uniref:PLD phosphodiesterase domain-containing protein n=1 Tax=Trichostrongylus colubriformis TaxID=6319 RepID=A0AAN8FB12_TRICO